MCFLTLVLPSAKNFTIIKNGTRYIFSWQNSTSSNEITTTVFWYKGKMEESMGFGIKLSFEVGLHLFESSKIIYFVRFFNISVKCVQIPLSIGLRYLFRFLE